jgi:hypothetical protein
MKRLLSFLLFLPLWFDGLAQQPFSYSLNPDDIPSKEVYRVIQDEKGYIWIGCNAGLFRYDGDRYKQYLNSEMSGRALSNLKTDRFGQVWCGSFTGQILVAEHDSLKLFEDWSDHEKQFPEFHLTENGMWITSDKGLFQVSFEHDTQVFGYTGAELPPTDNIHLLADSVVLVYSQFEGFFRVSNGQSEACYLTIPEELQSFLDGRTHFIRWQEKLLLLWQRNSDGKAIWAQVDGDRINWFSGFSEGQIASRVNRVSADRSGRIWVATNAGAILLDGTDTRTVLSSERVSDVFEDREGNLWFTTLDNGIFLMPSLKFRTFGPDRFKDIPSNIVSLAEGPGRNIILGHFNGTVSSFDPDAETLATVLESNIVTHRAVEAIMYDDGKLLAARGAFSVLNHGHLSETAVGGNTKGFVKWTDDTLLIATIHGLSMLYQDRKGQWQRKLMRNGFCRTVVVSTDRTIWAAFKDGVFYGDDKNLEPFLKNAKPVYAADIAEDRVHNVWIATISNGLLKISGNQTVAEFNTSNGLASNDLHCISISNDTMWIAHAKGLDRHVNGVFHHFNLLDGMPLKEVNDILATDGLVYLASYRGLTVFPTNSEAENQTAPKLITNSISLGDSLVSNSENASFNYKFNELKVDFSVLAFRSRGSCKVKYRLIGLDTTWTEQTGNHIEIVYNALPAGEFEFEAFALNEDGVQSEETVSFSFTIKPPFWQTWWFYLLVAVLCIALVSGLFLLRIRHINRKAALEHAVVTSKLTALRSQMNPHFLFNALNSIQELVLSKDTKNAVRYLGTFSGLTRTILENSAKETVRLSEEIDMLNQYLELEKLRFGETLEISIAVDPAIDQEGIRIPPMLIQPYVENALKHGLLHLQTDRKLNVTFAQENDFLIVSIEDNGVGRAKAEEIAEQKKKHQSFSSEATENRLRSMKNGKGISGSVEVIDLYENDAVSGTKVILQIPLSA